ncbi:MAG: flagellar basal body-associated FliL family protein [Woeseiaceae bacterium]
MPEEQAAEEGPKSKKKLFIIIGVVAVLAIGAGIAVPMFLKEPPEEVAEGEEPAEEPQAEAIYEGIHPPLLINFLDDRGKGRFLQISLEVMTRDQAVVDAIKIHNAVIRNNLILLYGDIKLDQISSRDGKQEMLVAAQAEINKILLEHTGEEGAEAVYFTNLVVQ